MRYLVVQQGRFAGFSETAKRLTARRVSPGHDSHRYLWYGTPHDLGTACPCQEAQQRGQPLRSSPEGSHPDNPIRRCNPCKGHAIHCGLRLVLDHPGGSEPIKPTLLDH